ncbi:MAG: nicotinate (nicotinamide) nucleotide adenylyltransferase [Deltaproteobacteria bacterium]|nr:MAG: nicotinate (nicotinamide) nucleotide adenylyltransferase [Deltaproteobacteria bacterium]
MTRALPTRVGVFGGTFNPIHSGHLRAAEEVVEALDLERMIFVPSAQPPHKPPREGEILAKPLDRLAWVRTAIAGNPRFEVDPIEVEREGASYMVDTLRALRPRLGGELPAFVIGRDAFEEIESWREPSALFTLAHFVVISRPPARAASLRASLPRCIAPHVELSADGRSGRHRTAGTRILALDIAALDISASDIRARLREGRSVRYLLPEGVREAVIRSGVYGAAEDS